MKILDVALAVFLFGMILFVTYLQGRRDERFKREWCCRDCRRKLWAEMSR